MPANSFPVAERQLRADAQLKFRHQDYKFHEIKPPHLVPATSFFATRLLKAQGKTHKQWTRGLNTGF